ncbi:transcription elongation factor GreA [Candidatus Parcubacteria bacterium]|nr:transcription elongation factor GreA [Candidatus Parcubacteria bacterium]
MSDQIISQEGYNKLKEELECISTVKRKEIANRIQLAKDMGDLSENAEYSEAKDAQAFNEGRIIELKQALKNVTIVKNGQNGGQVAMGSKVKVKVNGEEREYTIVSFNEADPGNGKISNESPLGQAFLDKKSGDNVSVDTPKGTTEYKIISVS